MVATQNIDTLGPIWTFFRRGVLTFVANCLDVNGCVFSYFKNSKQHNNTDNNKKCFLSSKSSNQNNF